MKKKSTKHIFFSTTLLLHCNVLATSYSPQYAWIYIYVSLLCSLSLARSLLLGYFTSIIWRRRRLTRSFWGVGGGAKSEREKKWEWEHEKNKMCIFVEKKSGKLSFIYNFFVNVKQHTARVSGRVQARILCSFPIRALGFKRQQKAKTHSSGGEGMSQSWINRMKIVDMWSWLTRERLWESSAQFSIKKKKRRETFFQWNGQRPRKTLLFLPLS